MCSSCCRVVRIHVVAALSVEVAHCPAVSNNQTLESPLLAENLGEKLVITTAWLTLECLICTHHFLYVSCLHEAFESIEISLVKISPRYFLNVEAVSVVLRACELQSA